MANVTTGPASKGSVSKGKKFPLEKKNFGSMASLGTTSDEAHRKIKGMKFNPGGFSHGYDEAKWTQHRVRG